MRRREHRCAISLAWLLLQTASLRPPRREVCRGLIAGSSLASLPASAVPRYTDRVARSGGPGAATLETVEGPGTDGRAYGLLRLPDGARCLLASAAPSLTFDGDRGNVLAGQAVEVAVTVGCGSMRDPDDWEGLAHLAEHVTLASAAGVRLTEWVDEREGEVNGFTEEERTTFTFQLGRPDEPRGEAEEAADARDVLISAVGVASRGVPAHLAAEAKSLALLGWRYSSRAPSAIELHTFVGDAQTVADAATDAARRALSFSEAVVTLYCPSLDGLGPLAQLGPLLQPSAYAQQWGEIGSSLRKASAKKEKCHALAAVTCFRPDTPFGVVLLSLESDRPSALRAVDPAATSASAACGELWKLSAIAEPASLAARCGVKVELSAELSFHARGARLAATGGASRVGPLLLALLASAAEEEGSAAVPPDASLEMAAVKRSATASASASGVRSEAAAFWRSVRGAQLLLAGSFSRADSDALVDGAEPLVRSEVLAEWGPLLYKPSYTPRPLANNLCLVPAFGATLDQCGLRIGA
ncbi:hypothetical protein EMIHUDRAFT_457314 [Emiliania huxleyi CCMP1516]|uniref:Peptidase M16 N-terminal domain-containing protein n=2 Tax=Emiliania huxleyi TaxID=2903 RepID=A0A0D3JTB3_EMIH1|nr:hypothetical protein EMIHUDRAFT_457314 [Emiliania huxleyi CCMP1516]EOD26748.1 hypothetical protein EMIHUDRAFT_457314 [Emiliania huxleyi CCMP1516]|eukprot:XP_005779177.1 hypothetical protein EMIHUDRAFT_457314 [Emiliania huxleyi CCMP1516]